MSFFSVFPLFKSRIQSRTCLRTAGCLRTYSAKSSNNNNLSELHEEFYQETKKYRRELKFHLQSSFRHRELTHSIDNINQALAEMESKRRKTEPMSNDISQIPSNVTLEVFSNGTTHLSPSVFIRTPLKTYLFNCPEGSSRFFPGLRIKPSNTCDLFITRARWENIGGLSGMLLSKEVTSVQTRIHGPQKIKQYLECLRPFLDADFGSLKYPVSVEELTYDNELYEDHALKVCYIPVFLMNVSKTRIISNQMVDVAYLIELKEPPPRIDIHKIMELKVPNGPLIGKLKAGEAVTMTDGRVIRPEDVQMKVDRTNEKSSLLVVEIECDDKLQCIMNNSIVNDFCNGRKRLNYMVHFTQDSVLKSETYAAWMKSFGDSCKHIIVNGTGEALPQGEGPYLHQIMLNSLNAEIFPLLHPPNFRGLVSQDYDNEPSNEVVANMMQRFAMRGVPSKDDPIAFNLGIKELEERLKTVPNGKKYIDEFRQLCNEVTENTIVDPFPTVFFFGTASAVPSKYRNVSGHLLRLSETSNILVDCGEGIYGQLRSFFGIAECENVLLNLNAVFITHAHQDHMNGLYLVIVKRIEAFKKHNVPYKSLIVVCNRNVRKPMGIYSRNFDDIEKHIKIVDVSMFMKSPSAFGQENIIVKNDGATDYERRVMIDVTLHLPESLFSPESWNLKQVKAVQVHHTRMANGFIFVDHNNGRKIVFSGDTMPCDLLVEQGRDADLLIHECTFEDGFEDDAFRKRHSTMRQAMDVGRRMGAKHIILSHFSARYTRIPPLPDYLLETGNVSVAMDNMVARYDRLQVLPKLLPVFRQVFSAELFDLRIKQTQRNLRKNIHVENRSTRSTSAERRISTNFLKSEEKKESIGGNVASK